MNFDPPEMIEKYQTDYLKNTFATKSELNALSKRVELHREFYVELYRSSFSEFKNRLERFRAFSVISSVLFGVSIILLSLILIFVL